MVMKFGSDEFLERDWVLPAEVTPALRTHVDVTDEGWIAYEWRITPEMARILQPWVDEPIDCESGLWFVGSVETR
jgi:hypothetical protein